MRNMKTIKVEVAMENDDGSQTIKALKGADATQWQHWVNDIWTHRHNPDRGNWHWIERQRIFRLADFTLIGACPRSKSGAIL